MGNTGQACTASKRLIVTEDAYEPFVEGLKQAFGIFAPGDRLVARERMTPKGVVLDVEKRTVV